MKKTTNGWSMLGICSQWCEDSDLTVNEQSVYLTIARNSVGYKKRWCYLKYDNFKISNRNTIKKVLESLVERKIIHYSHTYKDGHRRMNEYRLLEPKNKIKNFEFIKKEETQTKKEEEKNPWAE